MRCFTCDCLDTRTSSMTASLPPPPSLWLKARFASSPAENSKVDLSAPAVEFTAPATAVSYAAPAAVMAILAGSTGLQPLR